MDWRAVLTSVAGVLVIILQVITVLLSNEIDHNLSEKAVLMQEKATQLSALVDAKTEVMGVRANAIEARISENAKKIEEEANGLAALRNMLGPAGAKPTP